MTKQDRLSKIEELYEIQLIKCFENDETNMIPEMASVGSYLAKNQMVAEKQKSSLEDDIKDKVKEAERRRLENV